MMVFGRKKEASDEARAVEARHAAACRRSTASSASRPTSPGTPTATSTSATATSTRASRSYDRNGDWVKSVGRAGHRSGRAQHAAQHRRDAQGNIYVADRGNRRIQVFDHEGNTRARDHRSTCRCRRTRSRGWAPTPSPEARRTRAGRAVGDLHHARADQQYLYSSDAFPGRIYKLSLDGKVLGCSASLAASRSSSAGSTNRLPVGERALRRRAAELAGAEADSASGEIGS